LNDAIQIGIHLDESINVEQCHFLQFITHQAPDRYIFKKDKTTIQWEQDLADHMVDLTMPRWKVDSHPDVHPNPLYESGGAHIINDEICCIYDQPQFVSNHHRIIGCTFVIANNTVIGRVLWSRQKEVSPDRQTTVSTYLVDIQPANRIPDWALLTLKNTYGTNGYRRNTYDIPEFLAREVTQTPESALEEAKTDLQRLPPPLTWVLFHDANFSKLIQAPPATEERTVEKTKSTATHIPTAGASESAEQTGSTQLNALQAAQQEMRMELASVRAANPNMADEPNLNCGVSPKSEGSSS
jgi:hypothetical protein